MAHEADDGWEAIVDELPPPPPPPTTTTTTKRRATIAVSDDIFKLATIGDVPRSPSAGAALRQFAAVVARCRVAATSVEPSFFTDVKKRKKRGIWIVSLITNLF